MIRVILPAHLRTLAQVPNGPVELDVQEPITQRSILDSLETAYPMLRGTIRDAKTKVRRPFIRFYALDQDFSDAGPDAPLPEEISSGKQPFRVVGAMSGG